jgi:hypothetical protein
MTNEELRKQYERYTDLQLAEFIAQGIPDWQEAEFKRLLRIRAGDHYPVSPPAPPGPPPKPKKKMGCGLLLVLIPVIIIILILLFQIRSCSQAG